jgi:hypothetical protein
MNKQMTHQQIVTAEVLTARVQVSPELAAEWLKSSIGNRLLSHDRVWSLVREIQQGLWSTTHQGIAFDQEGRLLDGHHRLNAIVKAGLTVELLVTRGLSDKVLRVIDTGRNRSASDTLTLVHKAPNAVLISSLARMVLRLNRHDLRSAMIVTTNEILTAIHEYQGQLKWAIPYALSKIYSSPIWGTLCYAYPVNHRQVDKFASQLRTGVGLEEGDPALALKRWLDLPKKQRWNKGNVTQLEVANKVLGSLRAHLEGRQLSISVAPKSDLTVYFGSLLAAR